MSEPTLFGAGVISTGKYESHPAFTPDGLTLYFVRSAPNFNFWTILVSHFEQGRWSLPEVAPFSGRYSDADPFITTDGSRFYFISKRPVAGEMREDTDIWRMERTASGWSEPENLGAPVNSRQDEWYPTLTQDGTLYFGSDRPGGKGRTDLYRSRRVEGKYAAPENLGSPINTERDEFEPYIAPDESFLVFMASGRPDSLGGSDLYISHRRDGEWTKPVNLGDKINSSRLEYSPKVSPDGRYFFWSSTRNFTDRPLPKRLTYRELMDKLDTPGNGLGDIYQIDVSALADGKGSG
ncbi:MAG TPA: hypothetical protein VFE33_13475 [Thermoanaerobaculia bacterium]|nr:hypothetical protein [Thermoanaerobaculia bacterium]